MSWQILQGFVVEFRIGGAVLGEEVALLDSVDGAGRRGRDFRLGLRSSRRAVVATSLQLVELKWPGSFYYSLVLFLFCFLMGKAAHEGHIHVGTNGFNMAPTDGSTGRREQGWELGQETDFQGQAHSFGLFSGGILYLAYCN